MKGYIYKYTFPDGKVYIGQTRRPIEMRHAEHLSPSRGPLNSGFWEAYQTVGTPVLSILETIEADDVTALVEQLNRRETAYIFMEKATDPAYGYNKKTTATTYSPDRNILNKVYTSMCRQAEKEIEPFFDTLTEKLLHGEEDNLTEEEEAFVKGYIEEGSFLTRPVDDEMIQDNDSFPDEELDYLIYDMMDHAIWLYNEDTHDIIAQYIAENAAEILRKAKQGRIIQQIDMNGNVIREFESQDEIRYAFNIRSINNITNVIKGKQKTAYGFFWKYKPESDD